MRKKESAKQKKSGNDFTLSPIIMTRFASVDRISNSTVLVYRLLYIQCKVVLSHSFHLLPDKNCVRPSIFSLYYQTKVAKSDILYRILDKHF